MNEEINEIFAMATILRILNLDYLDKKNVNSYILNKINLKTAELKHFKVDRIFQ